MNKILHQQVIINSHDLIKVIFWTAYVNYFIFIAGAVLFIFNTQLCVIQCNQYFKLYTSPARLWAGGRDALLVAAGQYVTVVPFYLGKQRLAALVGSQDCDASAVTKADWGSIAEHQIKEESLPKLSFVQKTIKSYLEEGMSHRM